MDPLKKYKILTFGCQMNQRESEAIGGQVEALGYEEAPSPEEADLILVNTCAVRDSAERRILGKIAELSHLKSERPIKIGVAGCLVAQEHIRRSPPPELKAVDFFFDSTDPFSLATRLGFKPVEARSRRRGKVRAWVKVMEGCDNFCSYCIVPYVRGRERSRPPADILREVEELARDGFREVVLLGQNVNSYGRDTAGRPHFAELLAKVAAVHGIQRVRFITSHPRDLSDETLAVIAQEPKICRHFHLPVQAGSDRVLRAMNRGYDRSGYLALVERIRGLFPSASITTDIIVGFPGESESDFAETLSLCETVRFDRANAFIYSPRRGTPAATWTDSTPSAEKASRLARLNALQSRISLEINRKLLGRNEPVLIEGPSPKRADRLLGRTEGDKVVILEGPPEWAGQILPVRITEAGSWSLRGEVER